MVSRKDKTTYLLLVGIVGVALGIIGNMLGLILIGVACFIAFAVFHDLYARKPYLEKKQVVLAICPNCKSRISSDSKFCPECGANLQPVKKQK